MFNYQLRSMRGSFGGEEKNEATPPHEIPRGEIRSEDHSTEANAQKINNFLGPACPFSLSELVPLSPNTCAKKDERNWKARGVLLKTRTDAL